MRPVDVFVSPHGNAFMRDIAAWIVEAADLLGRESRLVDDGSAPADHDRINLVLAPHELYLLGELDDRGIEEAARCSIPICTEQPGTPWFDIGLVAARRSPMALDINRHGVAGLRAAGVDADHLRLGAVPSMRAVDRERDVDVLFLGGRTDRRAARLGELAPLLWDRRADLRLFTFQRPVGPNTPGLVFGADKYDTLAGARILLNLHRDDRSPGYFEWARMVEAMANGCCVLTEPVEGAAPFVAGEHFVESADLAADLERLLDDPDECRQIGETGRRAALDEFAMTTSLRPLLDRLDDVRPRPAPRRVPRLRRAMIVAQQHPLLPPFRPTHEMRRRIFAALQAETDLLRRIDRTRCLLRHGADDHVQLFDSPAWTAATPEVSVVVTLFNYAGVVPETIESIVASQDVVFEIVIVDDHSTDDGRAVVRGLIDRHPDVPIRLVGSDVNRGLPAARNLAFEHARADKVMVMDADNLVYPTALRRLADALDADPTAAFAYSMLEEFGLRPGVRSAMGWNPEWLCEANYIDAQAMLRRSTWERHGGYLVDDELVFGWEDWELWLRLAAHGEHGVHVPEMLGRYRVQPGSMLSTTNLVADHMLRHLRELHPDLPWAPWL
jgi:hypothetical protein